MCVCACVCVCVCEVRVCVRAEKRLLRTSVSMLDSTDLTTLQKLIVDCVCERQRSRQATRTQKQRLRDLNDVACCGELWCVRCCLPLLTLSPALLFCISCCCWWWRARVRLTRAFSTRIRQRCRLVPRRAPSKPKVRVASRLSMRHVFCIATQTIMCCRSRQLSSTALTEATRGRRLRRVRCDTQRLVDWERV